MELGATLCLPKHPSCEGCPIKSFCRAKEKERQHQFPPKKTVSKISSIQVSAAVIFNKGRVYIQKRKAGGLLGGLWEVPGGKVESGETLVLELTMLEVAGELENVDNAAACIRLQNEIEELRKDIQTRSEEIIDVRNQPGFFGNQSRQAITAQLMNENNRDNAALEPLEAQFEVLQCERVPRDEQQRPEMRPTGNEETFQRSNLILVGEGVPSTFVPNYELIDNNLFKILISTSLATLNH